MSEWKNDLPDDLRDDDTLRDIPDVATLAKSYKDAQSYIGRSVRIPGEDAGAEDWQKFDEKLARVPGVVRLPAEGDAEGWNAYYAKMGRPEKATDYGIEGGDFAGEFATEAHKMGLSSTQAKSLAEWWNTKAGAVAEQQQAAMRSGEDALRKVWGNAYERNLNAAAVAAQHYGGADFVAELGDLGSRPAVLKALAKIGAGLAESGDAPRDARGRFAMSPGEAKERINDIMRNKQHSYHTPRAADHADAVAKMRDLFQVAYPGE